MDLQYSYSYLSGAPARRMAIRPGYVSAYIGCLSEQTIIVRATVRGTQVQVR